MSGGRPTQYREEYCDMLIEHMAQGLSFESFAGVVGVDKVTIYNWLEKHPEFINAKARGRQRSLLFWEKMGVSGSAGQLKTLSKEIKLKGGKVTKIYKSAVFSAQGWKMNMKNRFGWKDSIEVNGDDREIPRVHLYLPKNGKEKKKK